jgi:hypothetical protein
MDGRFVLYMAVGKLLIWTLQRFFFDNKFKVKFLERLFECDLCLGTWVYIAIALAFHVVLLKDAFSYYPVLSEIITGVLSSFIMHILSIGWREKFYTVVV